MCLVLQMATWSGHDLRAAAPEVPGLSAQACAASHGRPALAGPRGGSVRERRKNGPIWARHVADICQSWRPSGVILCPGDATLGRPRVGRRDLGIHSVPELGRPPAGGASRRRAYLAFLRGGARR